MAQQNDSQRPGTGTGTSTQPTSSTPAQSQGQGFDVQQAMQAQILSLQQQIAQLQQDAQYTGTDTNLQMKAAEAQAQLPQFQQRYEQMLNSYAAVSGQRSATANVNANTTDKNIVTRDQNGNLTSQPNPNYDPTMANVDTLIKQSQLRDQELNTQLAQNKISLDQWQAQINANHQAFQDQLDAQLSSVRANDSLNQANGQQLGAETSRMDRLFTTAGDIADAAVRGPLLPSLLQNTASAGALQNIQQMNSKIASGDFSPMQYRPTAYNLPFDPTNIGTQIAVNALKQISPLAQQLNSTGAFQPAPTGINVAKSPGDITNNAPAVPYRVPAQPAQAAAPTPSVNSFSPGSSTDFTPGNPMGNRVA